MIYMGCISYTAGLVGTLERWNIRGRASDGNGVESSVPDMMRACVYSFIQDYRFLSSDTPCKY